MKASTYLRADPPAMAPRSDGDSEGSHLGTGREFRLLIVRVGAMGDVLHTLPAVAALRHLHPDWRIDWAIDLRWWGLLVVRQGESDGDSGQAGPGPVVDTAVGVRTRFWKKHRLSLRTVLDVLRLRRQLRSAEYDLCVDLQGTMRSAAIGWMAGARQFIGFEYPRERPARFLYGERVRTSQAHVIDRACVALGEAVGEHLDAAGLRGSQLPVNAAAEVWCDAFLDALLERSTPWSSPPRETRLVMIAPTAGWGAKAWGVERYGELARRLAEEGFSVLVNADTCANEKAAAVARVGGSRVQVVPCTIAELTALLRRVSLLIGGDTGPMHLADALGVRIVALFGPTDPARTGPYRPEKSRVRVLRSAESVTDHRRHAETETGLAQISVDEVTAAALELLRDTDGSGEIG